MKKITSLLTMGMMASVMGFGCVEENPTISVLGISNEEECSISDSGTKGITGTTCRVTSEMAGKAVLKVMIENKALDQPVWSGSGGGGTGSTFDPQPPNRNAIYTDSIIISCDSIDGKPCKDTEGISIPAKGAISAGGNACLPFQLPIDNIYAWGGSDSIVLKISVTYHDSGVIHGTSSSTLFDLNLKSECTNNPLLPEDEADKDKGEADKEPGENEKPNPDMPPGK